MFRINLLLFFLIFQEYIYPFVYLLYVRVGEFVSIDISYVTVGKWGVCFSDNTTSPDGG